MQGHFTVLSTNQVMDDVRARSSSARVAEPLLADVAHDNRSGIRISAVAATVWTDDEIQSMVVVLFFSKLQVTEPGCYAADLAVGYGLRFQLLEAIHLKRETHG